MEIIKKEDGLKFGGSFFSPAKKGALVLTADQLSFVQKKTEAALFSISVKSILNVRAQFYKNQDALLLTYRKGDEEEKLTVWHRGPIGIANLAGTVREPYFRAWELLIEDLRLGKGQGSNFDELDKLAELKSRGVITEQEFSAKKKQILGI